MLSKDVDLARMGEIKVSRLEPMVGCHGLGSCIGLIAYDSSSKVGGIAHVVLPDSTGRKDLELPGRYMDLAIPQLIDAAVSTGASRLRLRFAAIGGANVFKFGAGSPNLNLSIGERNIEALRTQFLGSGLKLEAELVGGTQATSTQLCLATGQVFVACGGREMNLLCKLGESRIGERNYVRAA